ncbi:MAG: OadG family protein [Bacilli bacterium]|nr:OadG family protein [Bacilli bacterium]
MFLINVEHQNISFVEGLLFSLVAILIVFLVLVLIILCVTLLSKFKFKEKTKEPAVTPAVQSTKKLTIDDIKDEDMMVAALVATAEFVEEVGEKDARLVSIKQIG